MQSKRQMLVKMDTGEQVVFDIESRNDYLNFLHELDSLFGKWIRVGDNAAIRKSRIVSAYYLLDGYNNIQYAEEGQRG